MILYRLQSVLVCIIIADLRDNVLPLFYGFLLKMAHLVQILAMSLLMRS